MNPKNLVLTLILQAAINVADGADKSKPEVLVRVFGAGPVSVQILLGAENTATKIFASAGVCLRWANMRSTSETESRNHRGPSGPFETIDLRFGHSPASKKPATLAETYLFAQGAIRINVFYDRIAKILAQRQLSGGRILGHVLAHEIGHALLRTDSHAEGGLMKAHWSDDDLSWIAFQNLGFTPSDTGLIRLHLTRACSPATDTAVAPVHDQ